MSSDSTDEPIHPEEDVQDSSSAETVTLLNTDEYKKSQKLYIGYVSVVSDDASAVSDNVDDASVASGNIDNKDDTAGSEYSLWLSKNQSGKSRMQLLDNERVMLNNWLKKIQIYRKATYRANIYYKQWDTFLGVIPIILNAVIILMKGYEFIYTDEKIITIANFAMLAVSTIFSAVHSFLKLSKQGESMRHVSDKLMQVYLQIQIYLAQSSNPLIPPVKFIEIVYKDIVALMEESGNVPISIMSKYRTRLQELDAANTELLSPPKDSNVTADPQHN